MESREEHVVTLLLCPDTNCSERPAVSLPVWQRLDYKTLEITIGREAGGWFARIDSLGVETLLFANEAAAVAAATQFVDGITRGDWRRLN